MSIFNDQKGGFAGLKPKQAFIVGLVGGVLVLCTIGFFVLLAATVSGGFSLKGLLPTKLAGQAGTGTTPTPNVPSAQPTPKPVSQVPPVTDKDHIKGSASAAVTLVEYSDYECPFCKSFHPTMQRLMQEESGKVRWVFRHFPLSFHQNAQKEAEASECVAELGGNDAFWNFTDKIFERTTSNGTGFALTDLPALAVEVGVARKSFEDCLNSGKYATIVQQSMSGGSAAGVDGTPGTIVINKQGKTQLIPGAVPYDQLKQAVESML